MFAFEGPRDRNVGPRLSGRRNQEDGNGGSDYPPRNARGARAGERSRGGGRGGRRGREYDRHSGTGREYVKTEMNHDIPKLNNYTMKV